MHVRAPQPYAISARDCVSCHGSAVGELGALRPSKDVYSTVAIVVLLLGVLGGRSESVRALRVCNDLCVTPSLPRTLMICLCVWRKLACISPSYARRVCMCL